MNWFLTSNDASARVLRTMVQGVISLIPGVINYFAPFMPEWCGVVLAPILMCFLSPLMAEIGVAIENHGGAGDDLTVKDAKHATDEYKIGGTQ